MDPKETSNNKTTDTEASSASMTNEVNDSDASTTTATDAKRQAEALASDSESSMEKNTPLSAEGSTPTPKEPMMSTGAFAILILFICAVIAGGVYWWTTQGNDATQNETDRIDFNAAAGGEEATSLDEIPEVVATVNGQEVSKERFVENISQIEAAIAQQGQDPNNPSIAAQIQSQALDQVINNEVLAQAAADAGVTVTDEEVAAELERIRAQFADEADFTAELENAGLTLEQLENNLGRQLTINQFVESSEAVTDLPEVTTEEARAAYEEVAAQGGGEGLPAFEEVEAQIVASISQQNQQLAVTELIDSLREAAEIEVLF